MKKTADTAAAPAEAPFKTSDYPFYWIVHTANRYLQALEPMLKDMGLDIPRWRVLMVLYEQSPAAVSEIAARSIIKLTTMTKIIQRMERDGLVSTRRRPTDNRATEVSLTPKGDAARRHARKEVDKIYEMTLAALPENEVRLLNTLLAKAFMNFDRVDEVRIQADASTTRKSTRPSGT
jgi:DNA-binding MarR family transcriptional regulator